MTSEQLRESGVEPARNRRYLIRWRERFRRGEYGVGGDLKHVENGIGEVRVMEIPDASAIRQAAPTLTSVPGRSKLVVSVPAGTERLDGRELQDLAGVQGLKIRPAVGIIGPHVELIKGTGGSAGRIVVKEGLWEERQGRKVDGGERRKAEVRAKRRSQERATTRK